MVEFFNAIKERHERTFDCAGGFERDTLAQASYMIGRVERDTDHRAVRTRPSWRTGDWTTLGPTLLLAAWTYVGLTKLWDTADGWRVGSLILSSVGCGIGLGQLPPVRFLLGRHTSADAEEGSASRKS